MPLGPARVTTVLIGQDEVTYSDLHRLRWLIPGRNVFFLRQALDNREKTLISEE